MASCQSYGPFVGTLNNRSSRCRIMIGTQKRTIILTTTNVSTVSAGFVGSLVLRLSVLMVEEPGFAAVANWRQGIRMLDQSFYGGGCRDQHAPTPCFPVCLAGYLITMAYRYIGDAPSVPKSLKHSAGALLSLLTAAW